MKHVKIGPIGYTIREVRGLRSDDDTELLGEIDYSACVIKLDRTANVQCKRVTLLHEVIHGILTNAGVQEHDESLIDAIAFGLYGVLRDNDELAGYVRQ